MRRLIGVVRQRGVMGARSAVRVTTRLAVAGVVCMAFALTATPPASAEVVDHSTFHFEFDSTNDCAPDGPVLDFHDVVDGKQLVVRHGDGQAYFTVNISLTAVTTIPGTDLTLTVVNKGLVEHDVRVTDNGDGTYTIHGISTARIGLLGPDGRPLGTIAGNETFDWLIGDNGTPGDLSDDVFLDVLSSSLHGLFDDMGMCEIARGYLP